MSSTEDLAMIRDAVAQLCSRFSDEYWKELEATSGYPEEFVTAMSEAGWLSILIPEEYGGGGLGIREASVVLEEVNRSGGQAAAAHAQMYTMGALVKHGSQELKERILPGIADGTVRLQAFGVTEPDAGSETTRISTFARPVDEGYVVNGQKVFISRAAHSDLLLLLARTTDYQDLEDKTRGLSLFLVDLEAAVDDGAIEIRPIPTMQNHHTTELFIKDLFIPSENLVGIQGEGFRHIIDGWNAERILVASEAIGDARWFLDRASEYARGRIVFGRPIGANQGIQFPLATCLAQLQGAALSRDHASDLYDAGEKCGLEANIAKFLASRVAWEAAQACMDVHGGYGFAKEYSIERKFRETRLLLMAPISNNLVLTYLAHYGLDLPRSY